LACLLNGCGGLQRPELAIDSIHQALVALGAQKHDPLFRSLIELTTSSMSYSQDVSSFPTLEELRAANPRPSMSQDLTWDTWPIVP